jgi:hypothetical protein
VKEPELEEEGLTLTVLAGNRRQAQVSLQGLEDELGLGPSVAKPSETGM